ncbi:Bug family tripartite tricarboxylate transporter substrate binding protein [Neoroseomonas soli]|uniref:Tripartite tricarboxylate transporter substrate binding protein n=1 Tax=Neoroseomonas soli TaxID=1081025 RepID=A0A9X9WYW9_9PROT|nr:tripartite tricarboxylate transporter substrate binding protein [Neoroseomonas soli]MBR0672348.1 tripartite tricarboxylate transporter substrate binding protein [Neoroseomonas soli]
MNRRSALVLPFATFAAARPGLAQAVWSPSRPVVLVVPFAPGGPNDLVARLVAPHMQQALGQNVVVENRPGATGAIGARHVAAAAPDGHTLLVAASGTMTINPAVMARPGYDPEKDFSPVSLAMTVPNMLVVHREVPARTVAEVIDWLKREGGRVAYSSGGVGSTEQLGMELFLRATGTSATHVPFPGGAPAVTAMIQGQCQASILNAATVRPHVVSGALRGIAIAMPRRFSGLPEVPTMAEAGYPQVVSASWSAFLAPANTPPAAVARLSQAITAALRQQEVADRLTSAGFTIDASSPEELGRTIATELARWKRVVQDAGIQMN